jgi:hypothetical protein
MSNVTLEDFANMIGTGKNFVFTKFGDGEVTCMRHWFYGQNCDGDKYNLWLSRALKKAFVSLAARKDAYIGQWHDRTLVSYLDKLAEKHGITEVHYVNYHFVMNASPVPGVTDFDSFANGMMRDFVKALRTTSRKKIVFSNSDNIRLQQIFDADVFIETRKNNWSYEFDSYYRKVEKECADGAILIIAAGMCSKVMIAHLVTKFDMTCIDIGSGFDLLATGRHSRPFNHSYEDEREYYRGVLPEWQ